jgi:hypothetical protein
MTKEDAVKIFESKLETMENGAICCNFGERDKEAFKLAIQALKYGKYYEGNSEFVQNAIDELF